MQPAGNSNTSLQKQNTLNILNETRNENNWFLYDTVKSLSSGISEYVSSFFTRIEDNMIDSQKNEDISPITDSVSEQFSNIKIENNDDLQLIIVHNKEPKSNLVVRQSQLQKVENHIKSIVDEINLLNPEECEFDPSEILEIQNCLILNFNDEVEKETDNLNSEIILFKNNILKNNDIENIHFKKLFNTSICCSQIQLNNLFELITFIKSSHLVNNERRQYYCQKLNFMLSFQLLSYINRLNNSQKNALYFIKNNHSIEQHINKIKINLNKTFKYISKLNNIKQKNEKLDKLHSSKNKLDLKIKEFEIKFESYYNTIFLPEVKIKYDDYLNTFLSQFLNNIIIDKFTGNAIGGLFFELHGCTLDSLNAIWPLLIQKIVTDLQNKVSVINYGIGDHSHIVAKLKPEVINKLVWRKNNPIDGLQIHYLLNHCFYTDLESQRYFLNVNYGTCIVVQGRIPRPLMNSKRNLDWDTDD